MARTEGVADEGPYGRCVDIDGAGFFVEYCVAIEAVILSVHRLVISAKHTACDPHCRCVAVTPHIGTALARKHVKVTLTLVLEEGALSNYDSCPCTLSPV
eukprot:scaffold36298_cov122-Isochrysis_galbana.AAC.15